MKTMNTLLLAGTVALGFTLATTARGDERFLSPKSAALRQEFRTVQSPETGRNLVSGNYLGALAKSDSNRGKIVPNGRVTPNLVDGNYPGAGARTSVPKHASFEIAPLAGKVKADNTCQVGCTMSCCAKK
jgi:hypothetical protein